MTTSNSFNYSVTALDIITDALENIGAIASGEAVEAADSATCLRSLNFLVKSMGQGLDMAGGLKMFTRKTGYLFLQKNQGSYTLGPSGDNAALTYAQTTVRVAGVTANTTIELTSTTGITAGDYIGIKLDSGAIQWTTVSSVTDSDTLVIPASGLTASAAAGNVVFAYTTKLMRPISINHISLIDTDGNENVVLPMSRLRYDNIPAKYVDSTPAYYLYENTLINGTVYFDVQPDELSLVAKINFFAQLEDYDLLTNDIAFPQEWYLALSWGLAKIVAPKFGATWGQLEESNYIDHMAKVRSSYGDTSELYFQCGLD